MKLTYAGRFGLAVLALATMAACSSPTQINTRDGQSVTTTDRPDVDEDKDFISYEKDGKEVQVNKSDVKSIEEIK